MGVAAGGPNISSCDGSCSGKLSEYLLGRSVSQGTADVFGPWLDLATAVIMD